MLRQAQHGRVWGRVAPPLQLPELRLEPGNIPGGEVFGLFHPVVALGAAREGAEFWVEGGEIRYPVEEITIAGNLAEMFRGIVAVGSDVIQRGSKRTGSVLIDEMAVAGD